MMTKHTPTTAGEFDLEFMEIVGHGTGRLIVLIAEPESTVRRRSLGVVFVLMSEVASLAGAKVSQP